MQGAQLNAPAAQHPRNTGTLGSRVRAIEAGRDATIEDIQVFGQYDSRLHHVQIVHLLARAAGERARKVVCLLLIVALDADSIARRQDCLEQRRNVCGGDHLTLRQWGSAREARITAAHRRILQRKA